MSGSLSLPWPLPGGLAVFYAAMSLFCFALHALDKQAAIRRRRRISERILIGVGLLGGWPGGIVAQRLFRHKTAKPAFQLAFRLGAALNVALLSLLWMPLGSIRGG